MSRFLRFPALAGWFVAVGLTAVLSAQDLKDERDSFDLAQRLFEDASYVNAAQEFRRFILNFPASEKLPSAVFRLAESHFLSESHPEAIRVFSDFVDRFPEHLQVASAMRRIAQSFATLGEHIKAGSAFQEVHDAFPTGQSAPRDLLSAGQHYRKGGDLGRAESSFRRLIDRHPATPLLHEAVYDLGRVLLDAGRDAEALDQFRTLARFEGSTEHKPDALLQIGKLALAGKDAIEAERVFSQLRKAFPNSISAERSYLVRARWFSDQGDWPRAARIYEEARASLPRNERRQQAILGLSNAYRKMGRNDEARTLYGDFLRAYPSSPLAAEAWLGLGQVHADLRDFRSALEVFKRLLEAFPGTGTGTEALKEMGHVWRDLGVPKKALAFYRRYEDGVSDPEKKARTRLRIAELQAGDLGWFDHAVKSYESLLDASGPLATEARFGLASTFEKMGRPNLAVREYRTCVAQDPGSDRAEEAETRIRILRDYTPEPGAGLSEEVLTLLSGLPALSEDARSQFILGRFLYERRGYLLASQRLSAALSGVSTPPFAPEARFLLGRCYQKLASMARLEGREDRSREYRSLALSALEAVVSDHRQSEWSDDAALALIDERLRDLEPVSARAVRMLDEYEAFQKTYPKSDRLDTRLLRTADAHFLLGETDPSQYASAIKTYRSLVERFPKSVHLEQAGYGIALCLARTKRYTDAEETLRDFLFTFPQSRLADHARLELGRILLARGFHGSAAEALSELLTAPSTLSLERTGRALLAESYFRVGDYDRAIQVDSTLLASGEDPVPLRRLGRSYQQSGRESRAVETYAAYLRAFPGAADADSVAFQRAALLADLNRTAEALDAFRSFSETFPQSSLNEEAARTVGNLLFQSGAYDQALSVYGTIPSTARTQTVAAQEILGFFRLARIKQAREGIKRFRKDYETANEWLALFEVEEGKYFLKAGNFNKADRTFKAAIKRYPGTKAVVEARYHQIRALHRAGKAEAYLEALVSFVTNHAGHQRGPGATLELADLYYKGEDYASAIKAYETALNNGLAKADKPSVLVKLSKIHNSLQFYNAAIGYARQLVREFPHHELAKEARIDIGNMLYHKGDFRQAIRELSPRLRDLDENAWSSVQHTIANCYLKMGEYDSARREFLKLRYKFKGSVNWLASAFYGIAESYEAQGEYEQAIRELKEIQDRFGSNSDFGLHAQKRILALEARARASGRSP